MGRQTKRDSDSHSPLVKRVIAFDKGWSEAFPRAWALLGGSAEGVSEFRVMVKGANGTLVLLKRHSLDGGKEIIFGGGADLFGALESLEGNLKGGRWREDRPYGER